MKDLQTFEFSFPNESQAKVKIQVSTRLPMKKSEVKQALLKESDKYQGISKTERIETFVRHRTNYVLCVQDIEKTGYQFFPA